MVAIVEAIDLKKTYMLGKVPVEALRGVNLQVEAGEFVSILGPSGSGKSTMLNLVGALDKPTSGKLLIDGVDISILNDNQLAELRIKIGFVFQFFNLLPRTTSIKNVQLPLVYAGVGKQERLKRTIQALKEVGLSDKLESTPAQLSGGQQQRVAIARALINNPLVIFADEPTGNLDTKSSAEIMAIFKKFNREGRTIIMITHEADIAKNASRIITIRDGQIVSDKKNRSTRIRA